MSDIKNNGIVLVSTEVELYVQSLHTFSLEEIASKRWFSQHEMIEKLNMQAIISASSNETEYVKDSLLTYDKVPLLVHELITVELWKEKIFPNLFKIDFEPKNSFIIYLILYHEATLVNLLETILYHPDVCQALDDSIFDLVDYCYRKLSEQIRIFSENATEPSIKSKDDEENKMNESLKELYEQNKKMKFDICMKLFSILRYIIDNLANLPLGVTNRILNRHDFVLLLVQAMELSMWTKTDKDGKFYKFIDNKWKVVPLSEKSQLTKIEGQIWISLYELLLNPQCISKYDYTEFKKNQILKLRAHLNEVLIDQIPNLGALQRFLEQLAISEPPPYKSDLIIEQICEIYDGIISKYKGKWKEIAKTQAANVLNPSDDEIKQQAKRWADTFNTEVIEQLIEEPAKCGECGQPAPKNALVVTANGIVEECQVKHWSKHKKACDMIFAAINSAANANSSSSLAAASVKNA